MRNAFLKRGYRAAVCVAAMVVSVLAMPDRV